jgi:formylglycine-generating enzyme required for sulfatase activity
MDTRHYTWQWIPAGYVILNEGGYLAQAAQFEVPAFAIGQFPVTNEAYGQFVAAAGYQTRAWWCDLGWAYKEKGGWAEPHHWHNREWNRPDHPVVGVSWYEAMAYSRWLSAVTDQHITLPTEQQWQRAAQGDDQRLYPWGNMDPVAHLCNWNRNVDETTPVEQYPAGASPHGVMDLCGNVWEWCLTGWQTGTTEPAEEEPRLLRGGCWSSDSLMSLRAANRSPRDPNTRLLPTVRHQVTVGFRCVLFDA